MVAVEVKGQGVGSWTHLATTHLNEGDHVEFLFIWEGVGGAHDA